MWIKLKNGNVINLAQAVSIFIDHDTLFYVTAAFPDGNNEVLNAFDNENDAKKFVTKLVDALNGNKSVSCIFNWLAKSANSVDSAEKHKNEILQDGQWY